ncbi:hypothetical protein [Chitinolyticbacter meiyuanensis]|uniref:hypothetical protein n=1 Tax=Chitinolyticbacter meiyuanensis TaxID=682798 RepID=UPI0016520DEC|nr:hypothetical protein [Chitinolyticbacter meiyuanensis]
MSLARLLYDHVERHYRDMLPEGTRNPLLADDDALLGIVRAIGNWRRAGQYRLIEARWW